jgi:nickel-dependent lactate racemase
MRVSLAYGRGRLDLDLGQHGGRVTVLEPRPAAADPIRLALAAPIGSQPLAELVTPGQSVVIITSDATRPCPSHLMLPPVLDELARAGIPAEDISVVLALGTHRPHTPEERARLVGPEVMARVRCMDSDPARTVLVGTTRRGTPVEVFEPVAHADVRVVLGNVEPHYFAGYSGGAKALVPGVCSARTIRHNHALMVDSGARIGTLDGNPVREDIEEAAALIGIDFMLNVIVGGDHQVLFAAAGHPVDAHRWLCRALDYQSKIAIDRLADIVVVSAGGAPKDINVYQAQKALDNAAAAVRPGGVIVWVAECPEGLGNATLEKWLIGSSADEILARIQQDFVLGGHKAAAIARVLKQAAVLLVSALPPEVVSSAGMRPFTSLDEAMQAAQEIIGPGEVSIAVMPEGAAVIPSVARLPQQFHTDTHTQ